MAQAPQQFATVSLAAIPAVAYAPVAAIPMTYGLASPFTMNVANNSLLQQLAALSTNDLQRLARGVERDGAAQSPLRSVEDNQDLASRVSSLEGRVGKLEERMDLAREMIEKLVTRLESSGAK